VHWERRSLVMDKPKFLFGGPEKMAMAFRNFPLHLSPCQILLKAPDLGMLG